MFEESLPSDGMSRLQPGSPGAVRQTGRYMTEVNCRKAPSKEVGSGLSLTGTTAWLFRSLCSSQERPHQSARFCCPPPHHVHCCSLHAASENPRNSGRRGHPPNLLLMLFWPALAVNPGVGGSGLQNDWKGVQDVALGETDRKIP